MVQKVSPIENEASEERECYICMQSDSLLVQPCACNAHVHAECLVQAMKKQNVTICTICKRPFEVKVETHMRRLSCNIIMFRMTSFAIVSFALLCVLASVVAWDYDYYMALWIGMCIFTTMTICVCVLLWRLYCIRAQRSCWCESLLVPCERRVTLHDGTCVDLSGESARFALSCTNNDIVFRLC